MSKQVDERIVSMQFDNKHFESNVATTMSTLDKLKAKLSFKKYDNSFDGITKSAKKVDLSSVSKSADKVGLSFSAMYTVADQALRNITNSAMAAGKKIVSALTIDPIKTGFQEYETQINAVQTILANTQSKGSTLDDVNKALDELNKYADQTIYNFTEMTRNIGTFTAAGIDLDTSVNAIKGIANLAAVSGSTSQQASTAMYQLSQALASGSVKLMDWNSVVNAGMGGQVFQDALKETARVHGIAIDDMIEKEGSFRETLKEGWISSEILTETLQKFTLTTEGLTEAQIEQNREMLKAKGYTEAQIDEIFKLGATATDAATKVKTFTQMWDVIKESVQSGWSQTWKLIIGDFEEAKAIFTPLTNFFTDIIGKMSDARNKLLESALGKGFTELSNKIKDVIGPAKKVTDVISNVTSTLGDLGAIVDDVIIGKFGNGKVRFDKLTEAGVNWYTVQNKVNEKLGDSKRYTEEQIQAQDKLLGIQSKTTESVEAAADATVELTTDQKELIKQIANMSEEQMRSNGYTEAQIEAFRELRDTASQLGIPLNDFIDNLDKINGRWLLINSFKNIGEGIISVLKAIGTAWSDVFPPMQTEQLFNIIAGFHKLTACLVPTADTVDDITRTFRGLFAALDIILTIVGGPIKLAFKGLMEILESFDMNIWDVTAAIGDGIVSFRNWLDSILDFSAIFKPIVDGIKRCVDAFMSLDAVQGIIENFKSTFTGLFDSISNGFSGFGITNFCNALEQAFASLESWINSLKGSENLGQDIISGLLNGLKAGVGAVVNIITQLGSAILNTIKGILGIHSPSTEFFEIGRNVIAGFINGLQNGLSGLLDFFKGIGQSCINLIKQIDFGTVFSVAITAGLVVAAKKTFDILDRFADVAEAFSAPFKGLGKALEGVGTWLDSLAAKNKAQVWEIRSKAILNMALSIGVLAGSLYVLAGIPWQDLLKGTVALAALGAIVVALSFAASKINTSGGDFGKFSVMLIGISASLLLMATAIKKLEFLNEDNIGPVLGGLAAMIAGISAVFFAFGTFVKGKAAMNIDKAGTTILKMSMVMLSFVAVIKLISALNPDEMTKGITAIVLFGGIITGLIAATQLAGKKIDAVGGMMLKISAAMLLLTATIKIIGGMDPAEITKGMIGITLFGGLIAGLVAITKLAGGKELTKLGSTIAGLSGSIVLLVLAAKMIAGMEPAEMTKGIIGITMFGLIIAGLIAATRLAGDNELKRVSTTLLAMSLAIGVLAATSMMLGLINIGDLTKGIVAVGLLSALMALMIHATKDAQDCKGNITAMAVAIGVMAVSVAALSFIDPSKLAGATMALSLVMGMFALMTKAAGNAQKAIGNIIVMSVAVGLIAGVIALLTNYTNVDDAVKAAASISAVMLVMSATLKIISNIKMDKNLLGSIASLTIMCGLLVGFGWAVSTIPDVSDKSASIVTLTVTMLAMTALLVAVTAISKYLGNIGQMLSGIAGLTVMCGLLVGFGWAVSTIPDIVDKTTSIMTLVTTMSALSLLLLALTGIGAIFVMTGGVGALCGAAGLAGLIVMCGLLVGFGFAISTIPDVSSSIPTITILTNLMVLMTGLCTQLAIVGPFALIGVTAMTALTILMVALGVLAVSVGALMEKFPALEEFLNRGIPILEQLANGLGSIIGNFISGFATGVMSGLSEIGTSLSSFITNAMPFINGVKLVDETVLNGVKILTETIALLTGANILESLTSWITGGTSIDDFGKQIVSLGTYISDFANSVSGIDTTAATTAADVIKTLVEMASDIPSDWGNNNITNFGEQISGFGVYISDFANDVSGINTTSVKDAADASKILAEMADSIPTDVGRNNLTNFAKQITSFADSIVDFSDTVNGKINTSSITAAADAAKELTSMVESIPSDFGHNNLTNFGAQLTSFGNSLVSFSTSMSNGSGLVSKAVSTVKDFISSLSDAVGPGTAAVESFKTNMEQLATDAISQFVEGVNTSSDQATTAITTFVDSVSTTLASMASPSSSFYTNAKALGKYLVEGFAAGIEANTYKAAAKAKAMAEAAETAARNQLKVKSPSRKFMEIGSMVVSGFSKGINDNLTDITKSGYAIGDTLTEATRDCLGIHSPALEMVDEGQFVVQGIAEGIEEDTSAEDAMKQKAQNISEAFRKEFDRIDLWSEIAEADFSTWENTDGLHVDTVVGLNKKLEYLNEELFRKQERQMLAYNQWRESAKHLGDDADETLEAYAEYKKAINEVSNAQRDILDIQEEIKAAEIERINTESEIAEADLSIWTSRDGRKATTSQKLDKNLSYLTGELYRKQDLETKAYKEWQKIAGEAGEQSDIARAAWSEYLNAKLETISIQDEIASVQDSIDNKPYTDAERGMAVRAKNQELWLARHEDSVSASVKNARIIRDLNDDLRSIDTQIAVAEKNHADVLKEYAGDSQEALDAWMTVKDLQIKKEGVLNEISELYKDTMESENDILDTNTKLVNDNYELWLKTEGKYASDAEKDAKYSEMLYETQTANKTKLMNTQRLITDLEDAAVKEYIEQNEILGDAYVTAEMRNKIVKQMLGSNKEYLDLLGEEMSIQSDIADTTEAIDNITENATQRQFEAYDRISEAMDTEYQIWEKTAGRKATSTEKNLVKLNILTQQLMMQTDVVEEARKKWVKAEKAYGQNSSQAQEAYNDYLKKQLNLANIQNEITDINESTVERQKLALSDYRDYVKKYEKYYRENGMTMAELERDARLVSGYDSNKTVNSIVSNAQTAFNNIMNTPEYNTLIDTCNSFGTSLVDGFVAGIDRSQSSMTAAVVTLSIRALAAAQDAIDTQQPVIRPVLDLSNVESGMARLSAMFSSDQAMRISVGMSQNGDSTSQNGDSSSSKSGNIYNYTQNNYSPKPLSAVDIYRQTKNQLSAMKGELS